MWEPLRSPVKPWFPEISPNKLDIVKQVGYAGQGGVQWYYTCLANQGQQVFRAILLQKLESKSKNAYSSIAEREGIQNGFYKADSAMAGGSRYPQDVERVATAPGLK